MLRELTSIALEVATRLASNCWPGYCGTSKVAFSPGWSWAVKVLRHLDVNPDRIRVGDFEQLLPGPATRIDQGADVGVALRDDTVERSDDGLEGFHRLQLSHISLSRIRDGLLSHRVACRIVSRLL
jgi:hypothetical protein